MLKWSATNHHKSELRAVCKLMSLGPFIHSCKSALLLALKCLGGGKCVGYAGWFGGSHSCGRGRSA